MTEWVSARGAADILGGAGHSRTMSRRILATGLAGDPVRTSSATIFDAARVRSLLARPTVDVDRLPPPCDRAVLEVRVASGSDSETWGQIANAGPLVCAHLRLVAQRHDFLPVVVTSCGYVLGGFEAIDVRQMGGGAGTHAELLHRPAGHWLTHFTDRRLPSSPGNSWRLWVQPDAA